MEEGRESMMRNFLWEGIGEGRKDHLINWEVVSKSRERKSRNWEFSKTKCFSFGKMALEISN